jgi:uncharacterized coiled-coil DUF342 family protein
MGNQKFEDGIKLFAEGNDLFVAADKLFDEADEISDEQERIAQDQDRISDESDDLQDKSQKLNEESNLLVERGEDGDHLVIEANKLISESIRLEGMVRQLGRRGRELDVKAYELRAKGRAVGVEAAKLHRDSCNLFVEGMIEWKREIEELKAKVFVP